MSKKKGVSAEEKRSRMLQIFYEKNDFFQLKELEKIAPKEKGIIVHSVKDVVQSLVDDGLVETDKIGTSVYYWAYPSKAINTRKKKLNELDCKLNEVKKKIKIIREDVEKAKLGKEDCTEREYVLKKIKELKQKKCELQSALKKHEDNGPEVFEKMKNELKTTKEAINRWTDNIFAIKSWCKNKFMIDDDLLNNHFGISPDMDYVN